MIKLISISLCLFLSFSSLSFSDQEELSKKYLGDMNQIVIEIEEAMRNMSMNILPPKSALNEISKRVDSLQSLKPTLIFTKDHNALISSLVIIRDGLKIFTEGEKDKSILTIRQGTELFKEAILNIKSIAEKKGLIPVRKNAQETKNQGFHLKALPKKQ